MKLILQNENHCQVITVPDGEIDLTRNCDIWDVSLRTEFAGIPVDVCVIGDMSRQECPGIDYAAPVAIEAYNKEQDKRYFECHSPIIPDEHTRQLFGITPEELIRRMAQIAVEMIPDTRFLQDFSRHDASFVRRTEAGHPFLWLVRSRGTYLCDLTTREDAPGIVYTMEHYRDECCLFHFDGLYLRPVTVQMARKILDDNGFKR